jgi:hypothetical protein
MAETVLRSYTRPNGSRYTLLYVWLLTERRRRTRSQLDLADAIRRVTRESWESGGQGGEKLERREMDPGVTSTPSTYHVPYSKITYALLRTVPCNLMYGGTIVRSGTGSSVIDSFPGRGNSLPFFS